MKLNALALVSVCLPNMLLILFFTVVITSMGHSMTGKSFLGRSLCTCADAWVLCYWCVFLQIALQIWDTVGHERSQGALIYAAEHMYEQRFWNIPLNTFSHDAKVTPINKDFVGYCLKLYPLGRSLKNLSKFLLKLSPFSKKWHFRPLNAFPALHILLPKRPLSTHFLFVHEYTNIFEWSPWGKEWEVLHICVFFFFLGRTLCTCVLCC